MASVPQDILDKMPYHLASDIVHDHGSGIKVNEVIKRIVRGNPPPANEDTVVATFDTFLKKHDQYNRVLEQRQTFELPPSTETLPFKLDWSPSADEFAFVHDAGPKLFKLLEKKNYITYGTILDSATKPTGDVYVPPPPEIPKKVFQDLGFSDIVGPMKLEKVTDTSLKISLTYNEIQYDMAGAKRLTPGAITQPKEMGKPSGYLASVSTVKSHLTDPTPDLFVIGKALGDALQVISVRDSGISTPRLIHNTEDRLNFVRCRVFEVPAVHVKRKTDTNPVRICEFIPSSTMISDTPADRFTRYLGKLKGFLQVTASNYDRVIKQFQGEQQTNYKLTESYRSEAIRILQRMKVGVLFHFMTWYVYYDAKKASPTAEDAKAISGSHEILSMSVKRLSPYGNITRLNGSDYIQKFVYCNAPPDDCDLGGFPIVPSGGSNLRERASAIVDVLLGKAPISTLKGSNPLTIDVPGLQTLVTELGLQTDPLVPPPVEASILGSGGVGFGIRGTYFFDLLQDAKSGATIPSRLVVGGGQPPKRKRAELEPPMADSKKPRLGSPSGTTDRELFEWYVTSKASDVSPGDVLFFVKRLYDSKTGNDEVFDFGLIETLLDEGIVPTEGTNRERCLAVWNAFMVYVNREILVVEKSNPWVSLHGPTDYDPFLDELVEQEQLFLRPPKSIPQTPPRPFDIPSKTRRRIMGASRSLVSPIQGLSNTEWNEAVRELEARYNK